MRSKICRYRATTKYAHHTTARHQPATTLHKVSPHGLPEWSAAPPAKLLPPVSTRTARQPQSTPFRCSRSHQSPSAAFIIPDYCYCCQHISRLSTSLPFGPHSPVIVAKERLILSSLLCLFLQPSSFYRLRSVSSRLQAKNTTTYYVSSISHTRHLSDWLSFFTSMDKAWTKIPADWTSLPGFAQPPSWPQCLGTGCCRRGYQGRGVPASLMPSFFGHRG